ncbi:MAG: alcohol dehydrogenase catalytic domain-containing protein, partial [Actinophytocola sp.]|nr:alcohol dehydrogenase catalytic domain-containing protein [Actinophytocola sp.]
MAGEVLVRVEAAGVCGTELHFLDGLLSPARVPMTLGHEVAGVVAEVGDQAWGFEPGDRVAVQYFHPCRACRFCRTGRENICARPLGFLAFATDGGFAEYVRVPASALVRVPEALSTTQAAPLCCSATTALHAADTAGLSLGDTAVVYGVGGVGLALIQVLVRSGVRVIAIGRSPEKLRLAEHYGASTVV